MPERRPGRSRYGRSEQLTLDADEVLISIRWPLFPRGATTVADALREIRQPGGIPGTKEPTDAQGNFFEVVRAEPDNAIVAAAYREVRLTPHARGSPIQERKPTLRPRRTR